MEIDVKFYWMVTCACWLRYFFSWLLLNGWWKQIHLRKIIVAIEMSGSCRKNESLVWNALLLCVNLYVSTSKAQKTPILIMLCVDFWELALVCVHII